MFQSYVDDLNQMRTAAGAQIPGELFQNVVSGIKAQARAAVNNPALQAALNNLAEAVDGAMIRSAKPDVAKEWMGARRDYRNLLMIDKAMAGGTQADRATGNIPFGAFQQAVRKADPKGYSRGRGEMNDLARIGDLIGSTRVPSSGTSERNAMTSMLTGGGLAGGGAVAGGADPLMSLGVGAAAALLPRGVQAAYNSPAGRAWMTNQLAANAGPSVDAATMAAILGAREKGRLTGP